MLTESENESILQDDDDIILDSEDYIIQDSDYEDGTKIIWSQTSEFISISITTTCVMSCNLYPNILILSPVDSPEISYKLPFYKNVNHQPLKLSIKHEQWRIVYLRKEKPELWPQLFTQIEKQLQQQKIEVIYNDQYMDMEDHYYQNNNNHNICGNLDTIDIDKILNAHGNKTGLEM
ncbi:unnamed protein product [Cunninghamella blakesleeana]